MTHTHTHTHNHNHKHKHKHNHNHKYNHNHNHKYRHRRERRQKVRGVVALSRLFRGKRWNPLRERIDPFHYNPDEIVMGTIFFTVALCCFPVMFAYHIVFCVARVAVVGTQGACGSVQLAWQVAVQGLCVLAVTTTMSAPLYSGAVLERVTPAKGTAAVADKGGGIVRRQHRVHVRLKQLRPSAAVLVGSGFTPDMTPVFLPEVGQLSKIIPGILQGRPVF